MKSISLLAPILCLATSIAFADFQSAASAGSSYASSSSSGNQFATASATPPNTVQASDDQRYSWLQEAENLNNAETIGEGTTAGPVSRFGGNIITKGEIRGPISLVSGNLFVIGTVEGPISVMGGNATILGEVRGPVSVVGGDLRVAGRITGDASVVGGTLQRTRTAAILGSTSAVGSNFASATSGFGNRWPRPFGFVRNSRPWFIWHCIIMVLWIGAAAVAAILMPDILDNSARLLAADPLRTGAIGFLVWIVFGALTIVGIILCFFLIGIPMLGILFLVGIAIAWFGNSVVFLWVGRLICARFKWSLSPAVYPVVTGAFTYSLIRFIPLLGFLVWALVGLLGAGVTVIAIQHYRSLRPSLPPFGGPASPFTGPAAPFGQASPFGPVPPPPSSSDPAPPRGPVSPA